jgi:hypothetical protein
VLGKMTNSLHRYGAPETLEDDYIVFAMTARGLNDENSTEKFRRFLEIAQRHHPINLGDATKGALYHPTKTLNPVAHWFRKDERDEAALLGAIEGPTVTSAVFDNPTSVVAFLKDVKNADLGLSINVSSLTGRADELARSAGVTRHSVEYSLGFFGALDKLPERPVLQLSTMCGHGMISFGFAKKMMDWVKAGRRKPEEASRYMARFCTCGIFNTTRASRILRDCACGK